MMFQQTTRVFFLALLVGVLLPLRAADLSILMLQAQSYNPTQRIEAIKALGDTSNPKAIPVLVKALDDTNADVTKAAAKALGNIADPQASAALMAAIKDEKSLCRVEAAVALGQKKDPRAVPPLCALMKDEKINARQRAAMLRALGNFVAVGDAQATEAVTHALDDTDVKVRLAAAGALCNLPRLPDATTLQKLLMSNDKQIRYTVDWHALRTLDPRMVDIILPYVQHDDVQVRTTAISVLARFEDPRVIEPLTKVIQHDSDASVRRTAVYALRSIDDPRVSPLLMAALAGDADVHVRHDAALALGDRKDRTALEPLTHSLLQDSDADVRAQAAMSLRQLKDKQAIPALRTALQEDKSPAVRAGAAWALQTLGEPGMVDQLTPLLQDKETQWIAVEALGDSKDLRAVAPLVSAMAAVKGHSYRGGFTAALKAIAQAHPGAKEFDGALAEVVDTFNDDDAPNTLDLLIAMQHPGTVEALIDFIKNNPCWAGRAFHALGKFPSPRSTAFLRSVAESQEDGWWSKESAMIALAVQGDPQYMEAMYTFMQDGEGTPNFSLAVDALGEIGGERATAALLHALNNAKTEPVRNAIVYALLQLSPEHSGAAVEPLAALMKETAYSRVMAIKSATGSAGRKTHVPCSHYLTY